VHAFVCAPGLALLVAVAARADDAPVPARGHGEAALVVSGFSSRAVYDDDGVGLAAPAVGLRTRSLSGVLRVGIGERLALQASLPIVMATAVHDDGVFVVAGAGDAAVGLGFGLATVGPVQLALRGDVKVPLYAGRPAIRGRQPLQRSATTPGARPALGDGQVDVTLGGVLQARFPFGGAFTWEQGYRLRTGGVTDGVVGRGRVVVPTLGGWLAPRWDHAFLFSFDPAVDDDGVATEIVGRSLVETGPGFAVPLDALWPGLRLDAGAAFLFRGRNAAGGVRLDVGVVHAF
jgi:hypothetical protein